MIDDNEPPEPRTSFTRPGHERTNGKATRPKHEKYQIKVSLKRETVEYLDGMGMNISAAIDQIVYVHRIMELSRPG